jgi:hypothetical protein
MYSVNTKPRTPSPAMATRILAGVSVPDTPLVSHVVEFAREQSEPFLFNHVMRSCLFAVTLAQLKRSVHDEINRGLSARFTLQGVGGSAISMRN